MTDDRHPKPPPAETTGRPDSDIAPEAGPAGAILGAVKWVPETRAYDEAFDRTAAPRPHYRSLVSTLESFTLTEIDRRERLQKISLVDQGITFTVYGQKEGIERIFPFDFVPRIIPATEWRRIEAGLVQR